MHVYDKTLLLAAQHGRLPFMLGVLGALDDRNQRLDRFSLFDKPMLEPTHQQHTESQKDGTAERRKQRVGVSRRPRP